jgi:serine/threonine protein kinase/mono/diheme cytochrome c family protein
MGLNRYRVVRRLATGPATEAFLAQQIGMAGLERLVVLKRLRRELADDTHYIRLFLEGTRLAGQLRHPNIVETLEVDQDGSVFFLVTEYLSGEELFYVSRHTRKAEEPFPMSVACQVVNDVASALAYAHEATDLDGRLLGIVHGEVNPRQILISYDGITKLDGFGLSKANTHHVYARPDDLRVKLAYGSPERVRYEELTPASDVFSLGVVLHELLTGQRLFRGKTPAEVIKAVMEQPIKPPSQLNKSVPKELDAVVMRALERDVATRTPSAEAFINELRQATQSLGLVASSDEVAQWMRGRLGEAHTRRLQVESAVTQEVLDDQLANESDVAPMFSSPGAVTAFTDVGSTGMGSVPSGVTFGEERPSALPWIIVGAIAIAVILGAAFYIGTFGNSTPIAAPTEQGEIPGVRVHIAPLGTTVHVDGALVAQEVGEEGVFLATGTAEVVMVEVSLADHETVRQSVQMPREGRRDLRLELAPLTDDLVVASNDELDEEEHEAPSTDGSNVGASRRRPGRRPSMARRANSDSAGPTSGRLVIHYSPSAASVTVDGVSVDGSSPLVVRDLEPGTHTLRVRAQGHSTVTREATVVADASREVRVELAPGPPQTATLDVVTSPSGAEVLVDGRRRGTSPLMGLELEPNREYRISARLEGHRAWSARVTPVPGRNPALMASLQAAPVAVAASPSPQAQPTTRRSDIRVPSSQTGSASAGRGLFSSGCERCHGRSAGALSPRRYTQAQWTRYFATARHGRRAMLGDSFSRAQLADVKAYLLANAADVESDRAAGVR